MLSKEDLKKIAVVVKEAVNGTVRPAVRNEFENRFEPMVLGAVKSGFDDAENRFQSFRDEVKGEFKYVHAELARLDTKIDGVEGRLGKKIDDLTENVDEFAKNQQKFDAELAAHQAALDRLGAYPA